MKKLEIPSFRVEIKGSIEELMDYKKQQSVWLYDMANNQYAYYSNLSYYVIDTLYNDFDLDEYKEGSIGKIFYDEEEAKAVWKFCAWFRDILNAIPSEINDAYLNYPEWHKVYSGAKEVFDLMDANDKKYNFSDCLEEFNNTPRDEWFKQFENK